MTFVEACRAWKAVTGKLPIPVTVLLEGEEESGGVNLPPFLDANLDELRADYALICDTSMWDADDPGDHHQPARPLRRGDRRPRRRPRPAFGLLRLGGGQPEPRPRPDHRRPPRRRRPGDDPRLLRRRARAARRRCARAGRSSTSARRTSSARSVSRSRRREGPRGPRADLVAPDRRGQRHGRRLPGRRLQDGDPGAGPRQDLVPAGLRPGPAQGPRRLPRVRQGAHPRATARSSSTSTARARPSPSTRAARSSRRRQAALTDEWGKDAAFVGGGGSIPVTTLIKEKLGVDVVMVGFGLNDDRIHSPNEKYDSAASTRASAPGRGSLTRSPARADRRRGRPGVRGHPPFQRQITAKSSTSEARFVTLSTTRMRPPPKSKTASPATTDP